MGEGSLGTAPENGAALDSHDAAVVSGSVFSRVHGGRCMELRSDAQASGQSWLPVDLSTCVDAFGVLEPVRRALDSVHVAETYRQYPDPEAALSRARLADILGLSPERIDVAPGAAEAIWTLARTLLRAGDRALVWRPCFSEFEHAAVATGAVLCSHVGGAEDISVEVARWADSVRRVQPKVAYLCAPSCPRGQWVPAEALAEVALANPQTCFVIDQSYLGCSQHHAELRVGFPDNVVLLRSLTKELGLPGVRVAYSVLEPSIRRKLQAQRPFWSVGAHALAVLEVYGECESELNERRLLLLAQARNLAEQLSALGLAVQLEDTHYFTVSAGDRPVGSGTRGRAGASWAAVVAQKLSAFGIAVRDCSSFGLPERIRIVAHPSQSRLVEALGQLLSASSRGEGGA